MGRVINAQISPKMGNKSLGGIRTNPQAGFDFLGPGWEIGGGGNKPGLPSSGENSITIGDNTYSGSTYADFLPGIQEDMGPTPTIEAPQLGAAPTLEAPELDDVQSIPGFDQSYWDSLYNQSQQRLSDQYFGEDDSLKTKMLEDLNSRGVLGTGVELSAQQGLSKNYGQQLADLEGNLMRTRAEQEMGEAKDKRTLQQERDIKQGGWGLEAGTTTGGWEQDTSFKQGDLDIDADKTSGNLTMEGLERDLRAALTAAKTDNEKEEIMIQYQLDVQKLQHEDWRDYQDQIFGLTTSPNFTMPEEDIDYYGDVLHQPFYPERKPRYIGQ